MDESKFREFDPAEYLDSDEMIAGYLAEIMETGDIDLILSALGDVARARGMGAVAGNAGISRESLHKSLRPGSHPRFDTILKLFRALNLTLRPVSKAAV